ncbi:MAG: CinA family protein, partial [Chloroflexi bacterium]|nr:CinA family protein [Chloroflexota bacterium]
MRQNLGPLIEAAERLQVACLRAGLTVALAESCTGGLIAHAITMVPGSSGYFSGGVVCYSDAVKRDLLDVPQGTIEAHGAVSEAVARAMASGARTRLRTDLGIGVTG